MKLLWIALALLLPVQLTLAQPTVRLIKHDEGVRAYVDDALFTDYRTRDSQKYPYFYPVNGPATGKSVTTESSQPFPHHQSLFFGCDHVNGGNYWQDSLERGQIVSQTIKLIEPTGERAGFIDHAIWEREGASSPFRDQRRVWISAPTEDKRIIDIEIILTALEDVTITNTNHSLFSARMVPELSVNSGGTMINSRGDKGEEDTIGKPAEWISYGGPREGTFEGLVIMDHPSHPWHPAPWFTRNYGFFSPTPMHWLEGGRMDIPRGNTLRMQYRVVVYAGERTVPDINFIYRQWVGWSE